MRVQLDTRTTIKTGRQANRLMALSGQQKILLRTLIKYTLIGAAAAFVVAYFIGGQKPVVEFTEISLEEAQTLAEAGKKEGGLVASYASAVEAAAPAVVNIFTSKKTNERIDDPISRFFEEESPFGPRDREETSLGSGVIISNNGYILTNNHVIEDADEIQIAMRDGRHAEAKVVGTDPESDVAVLRVQLDNLPTITLGRSDVLQIGDVVLAIGNPFGVGQTVTMGIVSATGRDRLGLSTFENFIQTDAAINPGNSGGALVNAYGHLIGINTAIFSRSGGSQGIGFAIPVSLAKDITEQIIERGHVVRGWIGIEIQDISPELAESFNLKTTDGVIVAGVLRAGPADNAGLKPGDVIVKIGDIAVKDGKQAVQMIAQAAPGTAISLSVLRTGKEVKINAVTAERPLPKREEGAP